MNPPRLPLRLDSEKESAYVDSLCILKHNGRCVNETQCFTDKPPLAALDVTDVSAPALEALTPPRLGGEIFADVR